MEGLRRLLEGRFFVILMVLAILYALFANDTFVLMGVDKSYDSWIVLFTIIVLLLFTFELIGSSIAIPGYVLGFFFWMDMLATVSLLFDIPAFSKWVEGMVMALVGGEELAAGRGATAARGTIARAGRAARAAARAGRIVRAVKLLKTVNTLRRRGDAGAQDDIAEGELEPSRVGALFGDLTTRKVIIIVVLMLVALPMLSFEDEVERPEVAALNQLEVVPSESLETSVQAYVRTHPHLVYLKIGDEELINQKDDIEALRESEIATYFSDSGTSEAKFDNREHVRQVALGNLLLIIISIVSLADSTSSDFEFASACITDKP